MTFSRLFMPGRIGACPLRNRSIMPLFPTKYATDSGVNDKMIAFYRARARGGTALFVSDCPCMDYPKAYKGDQQLRFDSESCAASIRRLLSAIQAEGALAFMQLNYPRESVVDAGVPGAKKKGDKWVVATSVAMSLPEAEDILECMTVAAARGRQVGYDGVEIQASYGDMIAQLLARLSEKGVKMLTGIRVAAVVADVVHLEKENGEKETLNADHVILCVDAQPEDHLLAALEGRIREVIAVGDAAAPGNLGSALRSATETALRI